MVKFISEYISISVSLRCDLSVALVPLRPFLFHVSLRRVGPMAPQTGNQQQSRLQEEETEMKLGFKMFFNKLMRALNKILDRENITGFGFSAVLSPGPHLVLFYFKLSLDFVFVYSWVISFIFCVYLCAYFSNYILVVLSAQMCFLIFPSSSCLQS